MNYYAVPGLGLKRVLSSERILKVVCLVFDVSEEKLKSKTRKQEVSDARHVCCYLLREYAHMTLLAIAKLLNRSDHTTVIHSVNVIKGYRGTGDWLNIKLKEAEARL